MTSPIDPIRRANAARRTRRSDKHGPEAPQSEDRSLPVPIEPQARAAPPPEPPPRSHAVFAAQLLGQDGQKRGLRGGAPVLNAAKDLYSRTEWSGPADRRRAKGKTTRTEV
jgi:hypothetical protein